MSTHIGLLGISQHTMKIVQYTKIYMFMVTLCALP